MWISNQKWQNLIDFSTLISFPINSAIYANITLHWSSNSHYTSIEFRIAHKKEEWNIQTGIDNWLFFLVGHFFGRSLSGDFHISVPKFAIIDFLCVCSFVPFHYNECELFVGIPTLHKCNLFVFCALNYSSNCSSYVYSYISHWQVRASHWM